MGLDITWYSGLTVADDELAEDAIRLYDLRGFPGRAEGVDCSKVYRFARTGRGPSRAYSSYKHWRERLALLAGYESARDLWMGKVTSGPFYELINFSDCMGTIGPVVSAKLAEDFKEFFPAADAAFAEGRVSDGWFKDYVSLRDAFEEAADSGAVVFR